MEEIISLLPLILGALTAFGLLFVAIAKKTKNKTDDVYASKLMKFLNFLKGIVPSKKNKP